MRLAGLSIALLIALFAGACGEQATDETADSTLVVEDTVAVEVGDTVAVEVVEVIDTTVVVDTAAVVVDSAAVVVDSAAVI